MISLRILSPMSLKMMLNTKDALRDYVVLVKNICSTESVNPLLILAIIYQESRGRPWVTRYEKDYAYLYLPLHYKDLLMISMETEVVHQKTSWGLMQIMGGLAREKGFDDYHPALCIPATNIAYGTRILSHLLNLHPFLDDTIASYNAGSPRKREDGTYTNQVYVNNVKAWIKDIQTWFI